MTARGSTYLVPIAAGATIALSSSSLSGVLRGFSWLWSVLLTVAVVVVIGLALRPRLPTAVVVPAQLVGLALLLTGLFGGTHAVFGVLPGPAALADLAHQLGTAVGQIETGIPPVPTTSALTLLVSLGFGLVAVVVDPLAMAGHAPAICGLELLGAYTVPTALAPDALPSWTLATGALGYALLLMVSHRERQASRGIPTGRAASAGPGQGRAQRALTLLRAGVRAPMAIGVTALAVVLALSTSSLFTMIGTGGRFSGGHGDNGSSAGEFGLDPFTSLRGQLTENDPTELLRVRGLPQADYLRAITLSRYVPQQGWQLGTPRTGVAMNGNLPSGLAVPVRIPTTTVTFQNVGFRDRWLPLYGLPLGITGLIPNRWQYDVISGTAYSSNRQSEPSWTERAGLPDPNVSALENTAPATDVDPTYLDTTGIDPRISTLAAAVTAHAHTPFDRVIALNRYFLDPASGFHYSLKTPPGNGDDALVDFLTRSRTGYCEQFASAMAVMLRSVGVPSRVAIGFTGGRDQADYRSISTTDAHAWVEAYFSGLGWLRFDPTPLDDGRAVVPSYVADAPNVPIDPSAQALAAGPAAGTKPSTQVTPQGPGQNVPAPEPQSPQQQPGQQPGPAPTPSPDAAQGARPQGGSDGQGSPAPDNAGSDPGSDSGSDGASPDKPDPDDAASADRTRALLAIGLVALAVLLLGVLAAVPMLVRGLLRRRRLRRAAQGGAAGAVAAWREMLAEFEDRGGAPAGNDTVRRAARRLARAHGLDPRAVGSMRTVVQAVERGWYAPHDDPGPGTELVSAVSTVRGGLDRGTPLSLGARLWPRSVRPRRTWWRDRRGR